MRRLKKIDFHFSETTFMSYYGVIIKKVPIFIISKKFWINLHFIQFSPLQLFLPTD